MSGSVDKDEADKGTASSPPDASPSPLHIMFLGTSIGNLSRAEAASFMQTMSRLHVRSRSSGPWPMSDYSWSFMVSKYQDLL